NVPSIKWQKRGVKQIRSVAGSGHPTEWAKAPRNYQRQEEKHAGSDTTGSRAESENHAVAFGTANSCAWSGNLGYGRRSFATGVRDRGTAVGFESRHEPHRHRRDVR